MAMESQAKKVNEVLSEENKKYVKNVNHMTREKAQELEDLGKMYQKLMEEEAEQKDNFHSQVKEKEWDHNTWTIEL